MSPVRRPPSANRLLVEGDEDRRVIPYLMEANGVSWGDTRSEAVVTIEAHGGITTLATETVISTELKASGLEALGIIVDGNDNPAGRWQSLRNASLPSIPDLPETLPAGGLVHRCTSGARPGVAFGIWIMPDNCSSGMMETFLGELVPSGLEELWRWADEIVAEASTRGAPFKPRHSDKARIHTWLAFQDPPGRPLHNAILERILSPGRPTARPFVEWFRTLFSL